MARKTVVLITNADSDVGYRRARELVADGHRVVITARRASRLSRILLGQNADHVMAIAADLTDPVQRSQLFQRADARLAASGGFWMGAQDRRPPQGQRQ